MDPTKRKTIIAGNWKMNMTPSQAAKLTFDLKTAIPLKRRACEIVLCVPYVDIEMVKTGVTGSEMKLGAQNVHFAPKGAYTGEISAEMLTECGVEYVIVGHSERRQYFGETDETADKRLLAGVNAGLKVILCVGETLAERESGVTTQVIARQTRVGLADVSREMLGNVIIAYEPVWAIGTGKTATADQAEEVCAFIRGVVAELYDSGAAEGLTIQYGGSMNAGNAAELLSKKDVDGGLIGGASLKPEEFAKIIEAAER
ncbi:MAG: triose-phosphate isomerase [Clostridia bacterium]|nr:triose-phosphate isomerase [Clostridia bacterium]